MFEVERTSKDGGSGEIRTLGRFAPTQPFQGCTIGHSDTEPYLNFF